MAPADVTHGDTHAPQFTAEVVPIFIAVHPEHIAYWKFLFEAYEEMAIVRTLDRQRAVIVVLAMRDFLEPARAVVAEAAARTAAQVVPAPDDWSGDWLLAAL